MNAQQKVQKLALYATAKKRLTDPMDLLDRGLNFHKLRELAKRLRRELSEAGIDETTLDLSGEDLSNVITEMLLKHGL